MSSPIPRTYWMNFSTGEQYRPPSSKGKRFTVDPDQERIPFPYCYQRLMLEPDEFREVKAQFIRVVNEHRFKHVFQTRVGRK